MIRNHHLVLTTIFNRLAEPGYQRQAVFLEDEVRLWPPDAVPALMAAKLVGAALDAETITCRGCEERCRRPVASLSDRIAAVAISTCHLFHNMGPFEHSQKRLHRWTSSREQVANFVGRAVGLAIRERDPAWRRVRFGTFDTGALRRTFSLEFHSAVTAHVSSLAVPLIELLEWTDAGITLDIAALSDWAQQSDDVKLGSKRVQRSVAVRDDNKAATEIRNRRIQKRMDEFARTHPNLNKAQLAGKIISTEEFRDLSAATIVRISRRPKKIRRNSIA